MIRGAQGHSRRRSDTLSVREKEREKERGREGGRESIGNLCVGGTDDKPSDREEKFLKLGAETLPGGASTTSVITSQKRFRMGIIFHERSRSDTSLRARSESDSVDA